MDGCKERCSTANHFHDNPALGVTFARESGHPFFLNLSSEVLHLPKAENVRHMCNSSHACPKACEEDGICKKMVRVHASQFSGNLDNFNFELKRMVGVRKKCVVVLEPGQRDHEGVLHTCVNRKASDRWFIGRVNSHGCVAKCEACEYYCDKPIGHRGMHSTSHGNMRNMYFVAKERKIEWDTRKYAPGEQGIAEMCNLYCSTAGRGHVHYLKCSQECADECVYSGMDDQRRHCNTSLLLPRPNYEVDEVLHAEYWKTVGWEDPCDSATEQALFAMCPYLCGANEHKSRNKAQSGCTLRAWHPPATYQLYVKQPNATYIEGHKFVCSHATSKGIMHHIFVLDTSGSMKGDPWQALMKGFREYLKGRLTGVFFQDIVSVVTFGDKGIIEFERIKIDNAVTRYVNFRGGGTYYAKGLKEASAVVSRSNNDVYEPVLLFFTDGRPADRKQGLKQASDSRCRYGVFGVQIFVVGFGRSSDLGLEDLAEHLGGIVHETSSIDLLADTFRSISMSLGARAGLICNT